MVGIQQNLVSGPVAPVETYVQGNHCRPGIGTGLGKSTTAKRKQDSHQCSSSMFHIK